MSNTNKSLKLFAWFFLSTGIFAIVGALYTWGDGPLLAQEDLLTALIPWADLLFTGPLSLFAAYGVSQKKSWGPILGLMTCGIYLFGSALVYISLIWNGAPYPLKLALPPLAGIAIGIIYPIWVIKNPQIYFKTKNTFRSDIESRPIRMKEILES